MGRPGEVWGGVGRPGEAWLFERQGGMAVARVSYERPPGCASAATSHSPRPGSCLGRLAAPRLTCRDRAQVLRRSRAPEAESFCAGDEQAATPSSRGTSDAVHQAAAQALKAWTTRP